MPKTRTDPHVEETFLGSQSLGAARGAVTHLLARTLILERFEQRGHFRRSQAPSPSTPWGLTRSVNTDISNSQLHTGQR